MGKARSVSTSQARLRTLAVVTAASTATLLVVLLPQLRFAYDNATLKIACETAGGLSAALAAFLLVGRFRLDRRYGDELLAYGLACLALGDFLLVLLPTRAAPGSTTLRVITWVPLGCQFVAAAALAWAARSSIPDAPRVRVVHRWLLALAPMALVLALPLLIALPSDSARSILIASAANPQLQSEPLVAGVQLLIALLLGVACVGFAGRADRDGDRFGLWLASGCGLTAVARLNFALFPSLFSRWLYTGDLIRLAGYGCWLVGSAFEIASYWQRQLAAGVAEERRRLARDLHDGLAQELAFLSAEVRSWAQAERQLVAASAAERALEESRRAIAALSGSALPFDESLRRTVEDIAARHGATARFVIETATRLQAEDSEQVFRIAREAAVNACRHGGASLIDVSLVENAGSLHLTIADNGCGFDADHPRRSGFGLQSMSDRAALLGGSFSITSRRDNGTSVEVRWS
jgi:signal transduction histidine kinase